MEIEIRKSKRRRNTVQAKVVDDRLIVYAPEWMDDGRLEKIIADFQKRLERRELQSPRFWKLVNRYPYTERARGFLIAKGMAEDERPRT